MAVSTLSNPSKHAEVYNLSPCKLYQTSVQEVICASQGTARDGRAPVCEAEADHVQSRRGGEALDGAVGHLELVQPRALAEVPELQGALLAGHHHLVQVGVQVNHAGRREALPQLQGDLCESCLAAFGIRILQGEMAQPT